MNRINRLLAVALGPAIAMASAISTRAHAQQPPAPQIDSAIPPLIAAIWSQDADNVKRLLADGADPNAKTSVTIVGRERPAWGWAITARDDAATELLLSRVETVDSAEALLVAAHRNNVSLTRTLLEKGISVDARTVDGATALLVAAASGHLDTLRLLADRGANVNLPDFHRDTALMAAVRAGSIDAVKLLIAAGADVNARDQAGRTALTWAVRSRRTDVMDVLRASGARDETGGALRTPLTPRAAVARSLPLIQQAISTWDERQPCVPCHHHPMMLRATAVARGQGFAIDTQLLEAQSARIQRTFRSRENRVRQALASAPGVLRWSLQTGGDPSFVGAQYLSSFAEAGVAWPSLQNEALLLARMQLRDGRWRYAPDRVPLMSSDFTVTAAAIKGLQAFASPSDADEIKERIERATTWLRAHTPATTEDKVFRLFGLRWAAPSDPAVLSTAMLLLTEQKSDGGWSQLPGLNSDAYATGQVLVALHEAGAVRSDEPVYQRGVQYLLDAQEPDGSWLVHKRAVSINGFVESGFPHGKFQFISYAGTCWATMALSYASATSTGH